MSQPSLTITLFVELMCRLRLANARYDQIARQYRRTLHPTHYAKRRAYMTGLRIDTSKANCAHVSATPAQPYQDSDSETGVSALSDDPGLNAQDVPIASLGLRLRNLPEAVARTQGLCRGRQQSLSPLELGPIMDIDDSDIRALQVPGAPRLRARPLPEEGMEALTLQSVSRPLDVVYAVGLGVTVPPCHLKRKRQEVEMDGSDMFSRQRKVVVLRDGVRVLVEGGLKATTWPLG